MRIRTFAVAFFAVAMASFGYTQEGKKPAPRNSTAELQELANPGAEHRDLAKFEGKWSVEIKLGAGKSASVYRGLSKNRMVVGGRFLACEFGAAKEKESVDGVLTIGFDRRHDEYTIQSIDSWGTYFVTARGKRDGDFKEIKLYGVDDDPNMTAMGFTKAFAFGLVLTSSDEFTVNIYMIDTRTPARREMLMMEYTFTRSV